MTTDPELDDLNSMLRLLLYANEIELAALVTSSSQFHYAGDPERGIEPFRWPAPGAQLHIEQAIDAYAEVYDTLVAHDERYPTPTSLRAITADGNLATVGDTGHPTPGSDLIADLLVDDEPGLIVAQAWGGFNTIARALLTVEERAREAGEWDEVRDRVTARTILTGFGEQDDTFAELIRPRWPELELRQVATLAWCYPVRAVTSPDVHGYLDAEWTAANVSSVGPMGAAYRVWGDGLQMADGFDAEDYFGLTGRTADELRADGYQVFVPPEPAGAFISEGDSSNFALHIDNGLRNFEHPTWGGWGGRQVADADDPHRWNSVGFTAFGGDTPPEGFTPSDWGDVGRWLPAFQRDFAARLRWTVTTPADANHPPTIDVDGGLDRTAAPGDRVEVRWTTDDPDGDAVTVDAWIYAEAGIDAAVDARENCSGAGASGVVVTVPADAAPGDLIHLICEATDDGEPAITRYARVVITVV